MDNQTICTAYEAVAAWDLSRSDSTGFEGHILVMDLDRGGAGLCQCSSDQPPKQIWEYPASLTGSFFQDAVWTLLPGCSSLHGAQALRESLTGFFGSRIQKNYIRSGRVQNLQLPEVSLDGQVYSMTCTELANIFNHSHAPALRQMLSEARAELTRCAGAENCRLVPVGELARLYLAEYMVRETFLEMPFLPDTRLRLYLRLEDPARIAEQGCQIYQQQYRRDKTIAKLLQLQVLRRTQSGSTPELLTLVKNGSLYSQLSPINYVGPICIVNRTSLTLYADTDPHHIPLPAEVFQSSGPLVCVEVGVTAEDDELYLVIRNQKGDTFRSALNNIN